MNQYDGLYLVLIAQALPWLVLAALASAGGLVAAIICWRTSMAFRRYQHAINNRIDDYQRNAQLKLDQIDRYARDTQVKLDELIAHFNAMSQY